MQMNTRKAVTDGKGGWKLRIRHKPERGQALPRFLIKCGCCDKSVEIYYEEDNLEINGVHASVDEWKQILGPLLEGETPQF